MPQTFILVDFFEYRVFICDDSYLALLNLINTDIETHCNRFFVVNYSLIDIVLECTLFRSNSGCWIIVKVRKKSAVHMLCWDKNRISFIANWNLLQSDDAVKCCVQQTGLLRSVLLHGQIHPFDLWKRPLSVQISSWYFEIRHQEVMKGNWEINLYCSFMLHRRYFFLSIWGVWNSCRPTLTVLRCSF